MKKILSAKFIAAFMVWGYCSCNNGGAETATSRHSRLDSLSWLQGSWGNSSGESESHENWKKVNDSVYSGQSFTVKNGDTFFMEHVSLEVHGDEVFYIPAVKNQNEGKPVPFKLISSADGTFVFENKAHDFPQRIAYANPAPDSVFAYIEGNSKGKYQRVEFPMKRVR